MKLIPMIIFCLLLGSVLGLSKEVFDQSDKLTNMSNSVSPILNKLGADTCGYQNSNTLGGMIVAKREVNSVCGSGVSNHYYAQCVLPEKKDVDLHSFSCIAEEDVLLPYHDMYKTVLKEHL